MRNLIFLLAILVTGMVSAQRSPISRTISGTIFNVTQDGTENDLAISTEGIYRVVDEDFLNALYEHGSMSISARVFNDLVNPHYRGPFRVLSFTRFAWSPGDRSDLLNSTDILDRDNLPSDLSGSVNIQGSELGNFREFILTTSIGSFTIIVSDDLSSYTVFPIGERVIQVDEIASYRSNGQCIPLDCQLGDGGTRYIEILKPGAYTISSPSLNIEYIHNQDGSSTQDLTDVPACRVQN